MIHWTHYCSSWSTEPLGDLCDILIGRTPSRGEPRYWNGDLPWLAIRDMNGSRGVSSTKERITKVGAIESGSRLIDEGTVLMSFKLSIGKVAIAERPLYTNEAIVALPIKDSRRIEPDYLYWVLSSIHLEDEVDKAVKGKTLNRGKIERLRIPIPTKSGKPDLDEQKRIAGILDKADTIRRKRQHSLQLFHDFLLSVFLTIFGDPVNNPKGWKEKHCLEDIATLRSGITKGRNLKGNHTREIHYLAVANVQDRELKLEGIKSIQATEEEIERFKLFKDDLMLTEGGDPDKLGRGTLWNEEIHECIHQNHIFRVRLKGEEYHPIYLNWLISSSRGKRYFLRSAKQTTGIASINMTQLKEFPMLTPPIDLQNRFASIVNSMKSKIQRLNDSKCLQDDLFASLQQRAFRGEL